MPQDKQQRDWNAIDETAAQEGVQLDKMHRRTKDKRVRQETSSYNKEQFDKLFKGK